MARIVLTGVVLLSAGLTPNFASFGADEAKEVNVIALATDSPLEAGIGPIQFRERGGFVIRDAEELVAMSSKPDATKDAVIQKEMQAELARVLEISSIDWTKQMAVAISGEQGTRLDRIHIDSLKVEGKVLAVKWKTKQRPPHAGPGSPVTLLLVDKVDEVKFIEMGKK